jgi:hypothetical protein
MMIYIDATALKAWSDCREFYRNREILNRVSAVPNIHYEFGKYVHAAVEEFWKGEPFEKALAVASEMSLLYPVKSLSPNEMQTWQRLIEGLPDVLAAYFDAVEYSPEQLIWCEQEWSLPYNSDVTLCGRLDRLMVGPRLVDVKTASEINRGSTPWKQAYREEKLLDLQFQLYDYWLSKSGTPPIECYLEVILKPYKSKAARYERIDLPEIITPSYRKRFEQQLAWKVSEITHYIKNYSDQRPWPMAGGLACTTKYGECSYAPACRFGEIPKVTELYTIRTEHLKIRQEGVK